MSSKASRGQTFSEFMDRSVWNSLATSTQRSWTTYRARIDESLFGAKRLGEITRDDVVDIARETRERALERGISRHGESAEEGMITLIRKVLNVAVDRRLIKENVAASVAKPKRRNACLLYTSRCV